MKLWLITQCKNNGYDTYDCAVVAALNEADAKLIHPSGSVWDGKEKEYDAWCDAESVTAELIGNAVKGTKSGVVCASFNAG